MIEKPKDERKEKKRVQKEADRTFQNWGRAIYKFCEACGAPISCLHHFYPKSMATNLRYEIDNAIPICAGCHFKHHNGDPTIHEKIIQRRGEDWRKRLEFKKRNLKVEPSIGWYKNIIEIFKQKAKYLIRK